MTSDPKKLERDISGVCGSWWRGLNGIEKDGSENRDRADRKSRAELRRAGSVASDGGDAINLIRAYGIDFSTCSSGVLKKKRHGSNPNAQPSLRSHSPMWTMISTLMKK